MRRAIAQSALVLIATGAFAQFSYAASPTQLLGRWAADVSKLPVPTPPKSVTLTLSDVGDGSLHMAIDTIGVDGSKAHAEATFKTDGTPAKVHGSLDVDTVSVTLPNQRSLTMSTSMAGHPSNSRVFTVGDDAKRMVETILGHGSDGLPVTRSNVWVRQ